MSTSSAFLELNGLEKSFGAVRVLRGLSLELAEGEILALLGLSGSGKTTALRLLAGFEAPDRGTIRVAGEDVSSLAPAQRGFGMVFQHYALFPHMTVKQNIAFGLESRKWDRGKIAQRVAEMLALVGLESFGERRVSEISGGQQQRVALARALAPEPRVLLLDEPLSNLDPALRERTRKELRSAVKKVGITTVLVTHEQEEAFHLGDRVAVLNEGHLEQVGLPDQLYKTPETRFVATFVGRSSSIFGTFAGPGHEAGVSIRTAGGGEVCWPGVAVEPLAVGEVAELVVRPECLFLVDTARQGVFAGRLVERRFNGAQTFFLVEVEPADAGMPGTEGPLELEVLAQDETVTIGQQVFVELRDSGPRPRIFRRTTGAP